MQLYQKPRFLGDRARSRHSTDSSQHIRRLSSLLSHLSLSDKTMPSSLKQDTEFVVLLPSSTKSER